MESAIPDFFRQWARGEFEYSQPFFQTNEDLADFVGHMYGPMMWMAQQSDFRETHDHGKWDRQKAGKVTCEALENFAQRIADYEQTLVAAQANAKGDKKKRHTMDPAVREKFDRREINRLLQVRQREAEAIPVMATIASSSETPPAAEESVPPVIPPRVLHGWKAEWDELLEVIPDEHGHCATVRSRLMPQIEDAIDYGIGEQQVQSQVLRLLARAAMAQENRQVIDRLCGDCGFEVMERGPFKFIRHKEYGLDLQLTAMGSSFFGNEDEQVSVLQEAGRLFEECSRTQSEVLAQAEAAGIRSHGEWAIPAQDGQAEIPGSLTFEHEVIAGGKKTFASRGYLGRETLDEIQGWIDRIHAPHAPVPPPKPAWEVKPDDTLIYIDSGVWARLTAFHAGHQHWLDFIEHTAQLPGVKLVIPAEIADIELQGHAPLYDGKGHRSYYNFNSDVEGSASHFIAHAVRPLLTSATRGYLENGQLTIEKNPNANPNILIVETLESRQMSKFIADSCRGAPTNEARKLLSETIFDHDLGDNAINALVQDLPYQNPAVIISADTRYLPKAPRTSGTGYPVARWGAKSYLEAELKCRPEFWQHTFGMKHPLSVDDVMRQTERFWTQRFHDVTPFYDFTEPGARDEQKAPQAPTKVTLKSVLVSAWQRACENVDHMPDVSHMNGNGHVNGQAHGNGHQGNGWAENGALRHEVKPRSIVPGNPHLDSQGVRPDGRD